MSNTIIKDIEHALKKGIKTRIGAVYPDIDQYMYIYEQTHHLIKKWYIDTLSHICDKYVEKYKLKHMYISHFYFKRSIRMPLNIVLPGYRSKVSLSSKTFGQIIQEAYDNNSALIIKIVDNDDNITFHKCTVKFSRSWDVDIMSFLASIFSVNSNVDIVCDIEKEVNIFSNNLINVLNNKFSNDWQLVGYKLKYGEYVITLERESDISLYCDIAIKTAFSIIDVQNIVSEYNNHKNVFDVIRSWINMSICSHSTYLFKSSLSNLNKLSDNLIMFSNITRYIHSNEAIWNSLCSSIMNALLYNYNTNKWFIDSIISLKNDPEMSFEDFYTKVKYCGDKEEIEYYNIYTK